MSPNSIGLTIVSYLRSSKQDQAKHSWAILSLLVKCLRQSWSEVEIIFRGDGGFCRHQMNGRTTSPDGYDVREERRLVSTTKSPTRLAYARQV